MKQYINKIKDHWNQFATDHKYAAKLLPAAAIEAGLTGVFAGAAYLAFLAAPVFPLYLPLTLIATAAAIGTGILGTLGAAAFVGESKTCVTDKKGVLLEGPRWAIWRLAKAEAKIIRLFNKQAKINADPKLAEAREKVTTKSPTAPYQSKPSV
jgi:hypothetical protein